MLYHLYQSETRDGLHVSSFQGQKTSGFFSILKLTLPCFLTPPSSSNSMWPRINNTISHIKGFYLHWEKQGLRILSEALRVLAGKKSDACINSLPPSHNNDFVLPFQTVHFTYFNKASCFTNSQYSFLKPPNFNMRTDPFGAANDILKWCLSNQEYSNLQKLSFGFFMLASFPNIERSQDLRKVNKGAQFKKWGALSMPLFVDNCWMIFCPDKVRLSTDTIKIP